MVEEKVLREKNDESITCPYFHNVTCLFSRSQCNVFEEEGGKWFHPRNMQQNGRNERVLHLCGGFRCSWRFPNLVFSPYLLIKLYLPVIDNHSYLYHQVHSESVVGWTRQIFIGYLDDYQMSQDSLTYILREKLLNEHI